MPDFLDDKQREITRRLDELRPLVEEYHRLEAAEAALAGLDNRGPARTSARRKPGRPRSSRRMAPVGSTSVERSATKRRATGRAKGSGKRAAQVLAAVQDQPGITIPEIAAKLGIKPNYLYRVMPALQKDGKIVKRGKGWSPKG